MADRVELRTLLRGFGAGAKVLAVECMPRAGQRGRGAVFRDVGRAERRLWHGVRADVRELVRARAGLSQMPCATAPGARTDGVRHSLLVARWPWRRRHLRRRPAEEFWRLDGAGLHGGPGQSYEGKKARAVDGSHYDSAAARAGAHISTLALKPP